MDMPWSLWLLIDMEAKPMQSNQACESTPYSRFFGRTVQPYRICTVEYGTVGRPSLYGEIVQVAMGEIGALRHSELTT